MIDYRWEHSTRKMRFLKKFLVLKYIFVHLSWNILLITFHTGIAGNFRWQFLTNAQWVLLVMAGSRALFSIKLDVHIQVHFTSQLVQTTECFLSLHLSSEGRTLNMKKIGCTLWWFLHYLFFRKSKKKITNI